MLSKKIAVESRLVYRWSHLRVEHRSIGSHNDPNGGSNP
jgi:hypothetical protein